MSSTSEKYEPLRVERIKRILEDQKTDGEQMFFEIYLDNLRVVRKTDDLSRFDRFKDYMDENTRELKIIIYSSESARNNKSYCFTLKENPSLGNVGERPMTDERFEFLQTKQKLIDTEEKLADSEEFADLLTEKIKKLEADLASKEESGGLTSMVKEFAPHIMGFIQKEESAPAPLSGGEKIQEASFKRKEENLQFVSAADKKQMETLRLWQHQFNPEEFSKLEIILKHLASDKSGIDSIIDTFQIVNDSKNQ